jgi:hypothetical protein
MLLFSPSTARSLAVFKTWNNQTISWMKSVDRTFPLNLEWFWSMDWDWKELYKLYFSLLGKKRNYLISRDIQKRIKLISNKNLRHSSRETLQWPYFHWWLQNVMESTKQLVK